MAYPWSIHRKFSVFLDRSASPTEEWKARRDPIIPRRFGVDGHSCRLYLQYYPAPYTEPTARNYQQLHGSTWLKVCHFLDHNEFLKSFSISLARCIRVKIPFASILKYNYCFLFIDLPSKNTLTIVCRIEIKRWRSVQNSLTRKVLRR